MIIKKPWGSRKRIIEEPILVIDQLIIEPHQTCSIHYHQHKNNTFYVLQGKLLIEFYAGYTGPLRKTFDILLTPGCGGFEICYMQIHRFVSEHKKVVCIEISDGREVKEEDIIRL